MSYAELQVTTHFSFLRGVSSAEELFTAAANLGITALGVVDRNSVAGMVRAWEAAKTTGVRLVAGCRLDLTSGESLLVYPQDRAGWSRLTRLLSASRALEPVDGRWQGKGTCAIGWDDVAAWSEGLIAALVTDDPPSGGTGAGPGARDLRRSRPMRRSATGAGRAMSPASTRSSGWRAPPG
jgi:error-prone DNA polymerase